MQRSMSIPEWHRLVDEGSALPVWIQLSGYSMSPLIRYQRDYVTIVPLEDPPVAGDIVLIVDPAIERYVMHRLWKLKDGKALTWGDNCERNDRWIPLDRIWGKAVMVERDGKIIYMSARKGMRWASLWHPVSWVYRYISSKKNALRRKNIAFWKR